MCSMKHLEICWFCSLIRFWAKQIDWKDILRLTLTALNEIFQMNKQVDLWSLPKNYSEFEIRIEIRKYFDIEPRFPNYATLSSTA